MPSVSILTLTGRLDLHPSYSIKFLGDCFCDKGNVTRGWEKKFEGGEKGRGCANYRRENTLGRPNSTGIPQTWKWAKPGLFWEGWGWFNQRQRSLQGSAKGKWFRMDLCSCPQPSSANSHSKGSIVSLLTSLPAEASGLPQVIWRLCGSTFLWTQDWREHTPIHTLGAASSQRPVSVDAQNPGLWI